LEHTGRCFLGGREPSLAEVEIDLVDEGNGTQSREDRSRVVEWFCGSLSVP
jgi:hypothetical protein